MSIDADSIRTQIMSHISQRIALLDKAQRFEDSYAVTQEYREWLLDPGIQSSSRQDRS